MKTTGYFSELTEDEQYKITSWGNQNMAGTLTQIPANNNRSMVYEIDESNIILKYFTPKGKNDSDIEALLNLKDSKYFPKLYAYKEREYLFMEKARGLDIPTHISNGISNEELKFIREEAIQAFSEMLDCLQEDNDFKLEHIFWCTNEKKLTWIDLGICDSISIMYPSKEEKLRGFYENITEELSHYGREI